jgi:ElaB/YqjD/DUF883 family membrane-anchored ribosome-binding protein
MVLSGGIFLEFNNIFAERTMTSLQTLARKLRNVADAIDELLQESSNETREIAEVIRRKYKPRKKATWNKGKKWSKAQRAKFLATMRTKREGKREVSNEV